MIVSIYADGVIREAMAQKHRALKKQPTWTSTLALLLGPEEFRALLTTIIRESYPAHLPDVKEMEYDGMRVIRTTEPMVQVVWVP